MSGGQTGVDRAALDAALHNNIRVGGWCPLGRLAEDGVIPDRYPLRETASSEYSTRTRKNVAESDGTLILNIGGKLKGGTSLTIAFAMDMEKPCIVINLKNPAEYELPLKWINDNKIFKLNVAGPRESNFPGIYALAYSYMNKLLSTLNDSSRLLSLSA